MVDTAVAGHQMAWGGVCSTLMAVLERSTALERAREREREREREGGREGEREGERERDEISLSLAL